MRYRVLESGAIACSAVVLWGWAAPPYASSDSSCEPPANDGAQSNAPNCTPTNSFAIRDVIPESVFKFVWGLNHSRNLALELEQVYEKLVNQAQQSMSRDRVVEALSKLEGIPKNSRHYALAKQLQNDWSQELLQQAFQHYQQANLSTALKLLRTIPTTYAQSDHVRELVSQWSQADDWLQRAQLAQKMEKWTEVINNLKRLEGHPLYQSSRVQAMLQEATNQQLEPDRALMQAATSTERIAAVTPMRRPEFNQSSSLPIAPIPHNESLEIATEQALSWAQSSHSTTIGKNITTPTNPPTQPTEQPLAPPAPLFPDQPATPTASKSFKSSSPAKAAIAPPEVMPTPTAIEQP